MINEPTLFADRKQLLHGQRALARVCGLAQLLALCVYMTCWLVVPNSHDAAVGCGFLGITVSLTPVFFAAARREFRSLLCGAAVFSLAPIWFLYLETVLPGYDAFEYTPPAYRLQAFCYIAIFLATAFLLYYFLWARITRLSVRSFSYLSDLKREPNTYFYLACFVFVFPLVAFLAFYGSANTLWTALTAGRAGGGSPGGLLIQDSIGGISSLMLPINWMWQTTPYFGTLAFVFAQRKTSPMALASIAMAFAVVFAYFLGGSRGNMMYMAAPILYYFVVYNWDKGLRFWAVTGACFFLLVGVMEMQVRFRGNLLEVLADPDKAAREAGLRSATTLDITESQRDNNAYMLGLIVRGYPDKYAYEGYDDFVATLLNPIPRAVWPGKPILVGAKDVAYQPAFVLDGPLYMPTASLSYSVVGEAYRTQGLFGVLFYAFTYALILSFFDALIVYSSRRQIIGIGLLGFSVFLAFWGFRSFFAFITFLYILLTAIAILFAKAYLDRHNWRWL